MTVMVRVRWRWYHGVLIYAGIQAATFGLDAIVRRIKSDGQESTERFYNKQKQPVFAPPAWAFAPAWTINNGLCIYALLRVLNMPENKKGRREFLWLQTASWTDFALFSAASFGLRSNYHGAVLTNFYLVLTVASLYVAIEKLKDPKTAVSLATLTVWLGIAAPLSLTMAAWNGDEFYGAPPLLANPPRGWLKQ